MKRTRPQQVSPEQLARRLANLRSGRDEMNFCELPFALLSERNNGRNILTFKFDEFDHETGQIVCRKLTVKGDPEFGLPTQIDEEIYLGLLKYSNDANGLNDPEVRFVRSQLFELMGWQPSDWAYSRLVLCLHRLVGVRLSYENLWRDNRDKTWRDQGAFGILDSFELRDSRRQAGIFTESYSHIRWGSVLFQSFDSGYVKRIDYGMARNLSATARRLYRYLDKHFYPPRKSVITIDLARLAYQHIGISPGNALDKVRKRYIVPAAEELVEAGFLKPSNEWFHKVRRGMWNAVFEYSDADRQSRKLHAQQILPLTKRGVSVASASRLVASHSKADLQFALTTFDEQVQRRIVIRNADSWFASALQCGYRPTAQSQQSSKRPDLKLFRATRSRNR